MSRDSKPTKEATVSKDIKPMKKGTVSITRGALIDQGLQQQGANAALVL